MQFEQAAKVGNCFEVRYLVFRGCVAFLCKISIIWLEDILVSVYIQPLFSVCGFSAGSRASVTIASAGEEVVPKIHAKWRKYYTFFSSVGSQLVPKL